MEVDTSLRGIRHIVNPDNVGAPSVDLSEIERRITGAEAADAAAELQDQTDGLAAATDQLQRIAEDLGLGVDLTGIGGRNIPADEASRETFPQESAAAAPAKETAPVPRAEEPAQSRADAGLGGFLAGSEDDTHSGENTDESGTDEDGPESSMGLSEPNSAPAVPPRWNGRGISKTGAPAFPAKAAATWPAAPPAAFSPAAAAYAQPFAPADIGGAGHPAAPEPKPYSAYGMPAPAGNAHANFSPNDVPEDLRQEQIANSHGMNGFGSAAYEDTFARQMQVAEEHGRMVDEYHELLSQAKRMRLGGLERLPQINYDSPFGIVASARKTLRGQMQGVRFTGVAEDMLLEVASAAGDFCDGSWTLLGNFRPDLRPLRNTLAARLPRMRPSTSTAVRQTFGDLDVGPWGEIGLETLTSVATTLSSTHRARTRPITYANQRRGDSISRIAESGKPAQ
jgi:hypothetical protein